MDTRIIINGWNMSQMSHKLFGSSLDDQVFLVFFLFNLNMGCLVFPVSEEVVQYLEIIRDKVVGPNKGVEPARENEMAYRVKKVKKWKWKPLSCVWLFVTPMDCPWNSLGHNTGVGSLSLLQGIFPTQGSDPDPGLPRYSQSLPAEPQGNLWGYRTNV